MNRLTVLLGLVVAMAAVSCAGTPREQPTNVVSSEHPARREADRINREWTRMTRAWVDQFGTRDALGVEEVAGPQGEWRRFEAMFLFPHFDSMEFRWRGSPSGPRLSVTDAFRIGSNVVRGKWAPVDEDDQPPALILGRLPSAVVRFER